MGSNNISNNLYQGWNCLIVIFPIVAALLTGIWFLIKRGHEKTNEFIIGIKEEVHTVFMNTIINEARRLIQIVDEHLPHALSQDRSEEPFPSRFDYFCTSLRQIPEAQLDRSGAYSSIIRVAFAGILKDQMDKLIGTIEPGPYEEGSELLNPTKLQFKLDGNTALMFSFLSHEHANIKWHERLYFFGRNVAIIMFIVAAISGLLCFIPIVWIQGIWGHIALRILFSVQCLCVIIGLLCFLIFAIIETKVKKILLRYNNDPGLKAAFDLWKSRKR